MKTQTIIPAVSVLISLVCAAFPELEPGSSIPAGRNAGYNERHRTGRRRGLYRRCGWRGYSKADRRRGFFRNALRSGLCDGGACRDCADWCLQPESMGKPLQYQHL